MKRSDITPEYIVELFTYNPETGEFRYRHRDIGMFKDGLHSAAHNCAAWNALRAGKVAGTFGKLKYRFISIHGFKFAEHRLAWAYMTGSFPKMEIDHIDRNPSNNTFRNLREASRSENKHNCCRKSYNTIGFKGVSLFKPTNKYKAQIKVNYKSIHLGYFENPEDAHKAYCAAAARFHGEFAYTN